MKKKWYCSNWAKGTWIVVEHVAIVMIAIWLGLAITLEGNIFSWARKYQNTESFTKQIYDISFDTLNNIYMSGELEETNEDGSLRVVDVSTGKTQQSQGLNYSMKDLKAWANQGMAYQEKSNVVVCKKTDGTYEYMYVSQFIDLVEEGSIRLVISDAVNEEETKTNIFTSLRNGEYQGDNYGEIVKITNKKGKGIYSGFWNLDGDIPKETYHPTDAEDLLQVANENEEWNGRLREAYDCLISYIEEMQSWEYLEEIDDYQEGNTNFTYLYVDTDEKKVYTNNSKYEDYSNYKKYLEEIKNQDSYLVIRPKLSQCETNMNTEKLSLQAFRQNMIDFSGDGFVYAAYVDTGFPIGDKLAESNEKYEKYSGWILPLTILAISSVLLFFIGLVWLTVVAGRKKDGEGLYLNSFDGWFTEVAAAGIIVIWLGGAYLFVDFYENFWDSNDYLQLWMALVGLYTCGWFLTGWLSLVRRIKAKTLWKGSLLYAIIRGTGRISENIKCVWKTLIFTLVFFLFQLFICGGIFYDAGFFRILILLIGDGVVLRFLYKRAVGRQIIIDGLQKITQGELSYQISLDQLEGEQKTVAQSINRIGEGLDAAVEKSLKNERMKTELITNVSHDIKTPLTSIINYIDLLKKENFTDPKIQGYLKILEEKAQRLKTLTEDVVEASKVSTGNVSLEMTDLNLVEMLNQVSGEFEEKFQEKQLTMVHNLPKEPVVIHADGRRMWRVLANIFNNVAKYAMEGTRVYVDLELVENQAVFSLKNISAQPLNISPDELTERFIRGDGSRSTEGSGLGLSIAQNLTRLQGGEFGLYLDGDLFKVVITMKAVCK